VGVVEAVVGVGCQRSPGGWWHSRSLYWWECYHLSIFVYCLFLSPNSPRFSTIMTFILLVYYYTIVWSPYNEGTIVWSPCGGGDGAVFSHGYTIHTTNSNLQVTSHLA